MPGAAVARFAHMTRRCFGCRRKVRARGNKAVRCRRCAALAKGIANRAWCAAYYRRKHGVPAAPPRPFCTARDITEIFYAASRMPARSRSNA